MMTPMDWIIRLAALKGLCETSEKVLYFRDFRDAGTAKRLALSLKTSYLVMHDRIIDELPRGKISHKKYRILDESERRVLNASK